MKSYAGPPMTLGNAAAARVRLIVWCKDCRHQLSPTPAKSPSDTAPQRRCSIGAPGSSAPAAAADNDGITVTILDPWILAEMEAGRLKPAVITGDMNEMHLCAAQLSFGLQCKPA